MILEAVCVVLGLVVAGLVWGLFGARSSAEEAKEAAKAHQADAAVNRARAAKFRDLLEQWGGDIEDAERQVEAAHGGRVGPAVERLNARIRSRLRPNQGGGEAGSGGEDGGVPPASGS